MKKTGKILISMSFFAILIIMFTGAVSATNWAVNPGDSIQSVVNNASNNDTIIVNDNNGTDYTYSENVVVNKSLNIMGVPGGNVTIQALNHNLPVFTINTNGSGSTIQNFIITGVTGYQNWPGIYIDNSNHNTISGNKISNNVQGITVYNSECNLISENNISNNSADGILISMGSNNTVSNNNITYNQCNGIYIWNSLNNTVYDNTISNNDFGFYIYVYNVYDSPAADINFNKITQNRLGLYIEDGVVNAQNNWWGSNNPVESFNSPTDIFVEWGVVNYNPWLVLKINATPESVSSQNSTINVDLTHNNQGADTSSQGHIPNNIPINFATNLGTVTTTGYTSNGRSNATFNRGTSSSGIANITATLDNQIVQTNVTIEAVNDTALEVTANLLGGVYNTTQIVTLTATDNMDTNPVIYYTTNGSNPTTASTRYVAPINIITTTILKFMAVDAAGNQASVQTVTYTINLITNINTGNTYSHIQDAINDPLTFNGHIIEVKNGTYTENVVVNKQLTLRSVTGGNPTINGSITINSAGSGSAIQGFIINGFISIYCNNCLISGNTINANGASGIFGYNSINSTIINNTLTGSATSGICTYRSSNFIIGNIIACNCCDDEIYSNLCNNTIINNIISGGDEGGIFSISSNDTITNNIITNNWCGIWIQNSISHIEFNRITGNIYGIRNDYGNVTAINNWWGSNNVTYIASPNLPSAPCDIWNQNGAVIYDPWIVLNLNGSVIHVTHNSTSDSEITADLTHDNHGDDTSSSGSLPDGLPVNFTTTLGTINSTATTKRGKATVTLTSNPYSDATAVTATLDNQTVSRAFRKSFSSIQTAVSSSLTTNGDVILVENGTYNENIVVNKNLTIVSEGNVTVNAANPSRSVFTIVSGGSGSLIQGFVISGAVNSYGLLLDGCSNCTINNNTITNNYFGILTNTVKTRNNVIISNNITNNQEIGLGTWNSDNYVIYQNTITYNGYGGIVLFDSNNSIIHTNLIMENYSPGNYESSGILLSNSNNTLIQNNLIPMNIYGLYIDSCANCTVYGNLIAQGIWGIYTISSSVDINFNRIASNSQYELISENGNINATNNWWGSNSNPVNLGEIVFTGYVNYNPWLVLSIDPSSTVNSGGNASITADLTHNNLGEDTSSLGHVIKGLPITFGTNYGTILTPALTFNGKAVAILNLGTTEPRTVTVNASLDSQTVSLQMVIAPGSAVLNITSSALNSTTLQPISLTYSVPLNSSVTWLSVLWKNTQYLFYGELQVIVNGAVVKSIGYVNPGYNTWKNSGYGDNVFNAIICANSYILQAGINPNAVPASFWNNLTSWYNLTSNELQFIQNHRLEFMDNLTVKLTYPGAAAPAMTVTDPVTNSTINLNFTGGTVLRTSPIMYMDGFLAGYEGVKSFAIATIKVNDNILAYWLNQNSTYPVGAMKAAYGTFLTALLVEYVHDQMADSAASQYNVTWSRTHPIAVSVGDDAYQTYLTLECDHSMGMTVIGSLKNTILFNNICSSIISPIENGIMSNLGESQFSTTNSPVNSVLMDLIYDYLFNNTGLEGFIQNGFFIIKTNGSNDNFLVIDPETGIVRDINTVYNYYGAYCFHDQLTSQSYGLCENFQEKEVYLNINCVSKLFGSVVKVFTGVEVIKGSTLLLGATPIGTFFGVCGIIVGSIEVGRGFYQYYDAVFNTPWTTNKSYEEQFNEDWQEWYSNVLP